MVSSARRASTYVREYSVSIVGVGLLGVVGTYAVAFDGSLPLLVLEMVTPTAIALGLVGYGLRTREYEATTRRPDLVSLGAVACGTLVALFCTWSLYLLSLRTGAGFVDDLAQPLIGALSTGMAFGGVLGHVYVDFTRHYRENERLSRAVDASMDGIAVVVGDEHRYVNDAYASLYGVRDASTLEGTEWTSLYANAARECIEREVLPALAERNYWRGTLTGKRADGTTFPQDVSVSALDDGYVVVARDVSEQRDREQRIQVLNRVLRHNLRNAATVIKGHASLIGDRHPDLEDAHVRPILEETDDLIATADKARGVERTLERNGNADLIEATEAVRSVVDRARAAHPDARIVAQTEAPAANATRPTVDGSVVDALNELVDNAVEHNPARSDADPDSGSNENRNGNGYASDGIESENGNATPTAAADGDPAVEVAVRTVEYDTEPRLEFTVADNGDGIPETERRAVLDGRETQLDHGSGLGLWLVNWIVQNAGGDLRFSDRPDGGTVVTLSFPIERAGEPDRALTAPL